MKRIDEFFILELYNGIRTSDVTGRIIMNNSLYSSNWNNAFILHKFLIHNMFDA